MKLLDCDLIEGEETGHGSVKFEFEGYVYYIGHLEGPPGWFSRIRVEDYENGGDKWEAPSGWGPENIASYKLLKNNRG